MKGFTLFTALVGIALIALTALLIQGMIKAERDSLNILSNIEEQAELQAIADLERADALNTFNLTLRFALERYFTDPEQGGVLNIQGRSWLELKENFAQVYFAGTNQDNTSEQFGSFLAGQLEESLEVRRQIGQYEISFENDVTQGVDTVAALDAIFSTSVEDEDFFEVVTDEDCENGLLSCIGTFYITLDASENRLSDEDYEKLPKVVVKHLRTGRTLKQAILPRGKFKFFVPLRFFKALSKVYNLSNDDFGLLSARIHNELEEMRIGFCDPGYCHPRNNPYTPPEFLDYKGASCTNIALDLHCTTEMQQKGICNSVGTNFLPFDAGSVRGITTQSFNTIIKNRLCKIIIDDSDFVGESDFELIGGECSGKVSMILTDFGLTETKRGLTRTGNAPSNVVTRTPYTYSGNIDGACPLRQSIGGRGNEIGFYEENGEIINPLEEIEQLRIENEEEFAASNAEIGSCVELSSYTIYLKFKENNSKYVVNKRLLSDSSKAFVLKLRDSFVPYTEKFGSNNVNPSTCALTQKPTYLGNIQATECYSFDNGNNNSNSGCFTNT
jgi:hypothetical protein